MTVIAATFARPCIAIATDSLIVSRTANGSLEPKSWSARKIIPVRPLRAAISYYGFAGTSQISTYQWLTSFTRRNLDSPSLQEFAIRLRSGLNSFINAHPFANEIDSGIGVHITGYEQYDGYWIPELFYCTNFQSPAYTEICPLQVGRHSFHTLSNGTDHNIERHHEPQYRHAVREYLEQGNTIRYNNGDPFFFNASARLIQDLIHEADRRGACDHDSLHKYYRMLTRLPIEVVTAVQRNFFKSGQKRVGGRVHDLLILPNSSITSTTGDDQLK